MKLLGDLISDAARLLGIRECGACKRRKKKLNDADTKVRAKLRGRPCAECEKVKRM
jgi:hypothetical protein